MVRANRIPSSTSLGALAIDQAKPDELTIVMGIIEEAAAWLHARGITEQWSSPMPRAFWDKIGIQIADGNVFIARLPDAQAVGVFRFEWRDAQFWQPDSDGGGYIQFCNSHKRAWSRHWRGDDRMGKGKRARARQEIFAARLLGRESAIVRSLRGIGIYVLRHSLRRG